MARRTLADHGAFIQRWLKPDLTILDLGCGPGSITLDLAHQVPLGRVVGIDRAESQVALARAAAIERGFTNVDFQLGDAGDVRIADGEFDLIFSHALFEHLANPVQVLKDLRRLLRREGRIALRSPDWGGWVLYPEKPDCKAAIAAYGELQRSNGGDIHAGRKLKSWLTATGYEDIRVSAGYEIYPSAGMIADYLATQLDLAGMGIHAAALRNWAQEPEALFAQAWFEAVGLKT